MNGTLIGLLAGLVLGFAGAFSGLVAFVIDAGSAHRGPGALDGPREGAGRVPDRAGGRP
jgi:hypothetical protein